MSAREELARIIGRVTDPQDAADAILASDWLAKECADERERIAVAIEGMTDGYRDNDLGEAFHRAKRAAARIARATTTTEVGVCSTCGSSFDSPPCQRSANGARGHTSGGGTTGTTETNEGARDG